MPIKYKRGGKIEYTLILLLQKQNDEGKLELIYIIESKGDQLADNLDTKYKQLVFQKMTESSVINSIKQFDSYEFNLIPQSETRKKIRELFR
jgi:hypothetical protein